MNGVERAHLRHLIDQTVREGNAFKNVCAECLEPLKTPATARNKFCNRKCNSAYYWREHKAKRLSGLSQGEQGRSHQERTTAGFSPGIDSCPVPTTPNTFEAAA
jgi:hypothetical protein